MEHITSNTASFCDDGLGVPESKLALLCFVVPCAVFCCCWLEVPSGKFCGQPDSQISQPSPPFWILHNVGRTLSQRRGRLDRPSASQDGGNPETEHPTPDLEILGWVWSSSRCFLRRTTGRGSEDWRSRFRAMFRDDFCICHVRECFTRCHPQVNVVSDWIGFA